MTTSLCPATKSMSLVERKKQQWAKEKEELANLSAPFKQYNHNFEQPFERPRYGSRPSMVQKQASEDYHKNQQRRGSLPPLYKNQYNSNYAYDRGGETSGYGSDSYHTPEDILPPATQWTAPQQSGYESSSSRDDRPKWGDKGVGVGKFWQPKEEERFDKIAIEPPNWVKRGLHVDGAIVVANSSPSVSPEQRFEDNDRPCTGSSLSQHKTYIRGQNIHIDAVELAERERRRQMALAHQDAIRQQLEERETKRQEERMKRIIEEREEELRIEREREIEKKKKLEEERRLQEKLERERKRKAALQEALETAEKEAKLEKMRLRMMKQSSSQNIAINNITENVVEKEKVPDDTLIIEPNTEQKKDYYEDQNNNEQLNNTKEVLSPVQKNENAVKEINNNLDEASISVSSPSKSLIGNPESSVSKHHQQNQNNRSLTPMQTPRNDQLTYFLQPSLEALQNIQYAVLIPASTPQFPIAIPVNLPQTDRSVVSTARTENRILTPTQYRNARKCDSSTQTDNSYSARSSSETTDSREKYLREKITNLELAYDNRRKERRSQSESMGERPKWGVNRPPTRYLKQSEKDPLYQRRKLRQKRDNANKSYDEKNSSDESQTGTPIRYRKKEFSEKRNSRARWRTEERLFSGNVKMYQREIVPLETDKDQLYYKCCCTCRCQRHRCSDKVRVDVLKIEENCSPREMERYYQKNADRHRERELSLSDCNVNCIENNNNNKVDILNKLSSLHSGLLLEQEKWENSPRTPVLSPP